VPIWTEIGHRRKNKGNVENIQPRKTCLKQNELQNESKSREIDIFQKEEEKVTNIKKS
jgi:hypothetical protein